MLKLIKRTLLISLLSPNLFASYTFPIEGDAAGFKVSYSNETLPGEYTVIWSHQNSILSLSRLYEENGTSLGYVLLQRNLKPKQDALIHGAFKNENLSFVFPPVQRSLEIRFDIQKEASGSVSLIPQGNVSDSSRQD